MQQFQEHRNCPKCGSISVKTEYHGHVRPSGCSFRLGEHLHRLCQGCHYDWLERPLDASGERELVEA